MRNVTLILDDGSRFSGKSFGYEKPVAGEVVFNTAIIFEGRIQLFVHDVDDVRTISTNLRKISEVKTVTRIEKFEDLPN